jgi:hypothetical protein
LFEVRIGADAGGLEVIATSVTRSVRMQRGERYPFAPKLGSVVTSQLSCRRGRPGGYFTQDQWQRHADGGVPG